MDLEGHTMNYTVPSVHEEDEIIRTLPRKYDTLVSCPHDPPADVVVENIEKVAPGEKAVTVTYEPSLNPEDPTADDYDEIKEWTDGLFEWIADGCPRSL